MTDTPNQIPPWVLRLIERAPTDRPVVVLLRHSIRDELPPDDVGYDLPITDAGRRIANELGSVFGTRLQTLHASPLLRCLQTAQALADGAGVGLPVVPNRLLGDPGVFVLDGQRAWENWQQLGHTGVMRHLVHETTALPGMASPDHAARFLVQSMLGVGSDRPGAHVFVTHDTLVLATAARLLGSPLGAEDWPWYLEGAFFWPGLDGGVHSAYRDHEAVHAGPLCGLSEEDVAEFARREIANTIGLDSGAHFFVAGGAFKSLLTGREPRDLDLWAPSESDRDRLLSAMEARGAKPIGHLPFADAFDVAGRTVKIHRQTEPNTLAERLARSDIGLSAVGVEHRADDNVSARVDPLALESVRRREVLLRRPLTNGKSALSTLERLRRYAQELSFSVPKEEEAELWRMFDSQTAEQRAETISHYRHATAASASDSASDVILKELAHRSR